MSGTQELAVREKQELARKEEKTVPGRYYVPNADIYETEEAMTVILEMPGVERDNVTIALEDDVLRVEGQIDFTKYDEMQPVYAEYNIGHYARGFTLSGKIDREAISAQLEGGVLTLTLPKAKESMPRRIKIN
jgi:HSP20 family molecular chaperone IbpA